MSGLRWRTFYFTLIIFILCNYFQGLSHKEINKSLLFDLMKSTPPNIVVALMTQCKSFSILLRLLFAKTSRSSEKDMLASQFLTLLPKENCSADILRQYLESKTVKQEPGTSVTDDLKNIVETDGLVTSIKSEQVLSFPDNLGEKLGKILLEDETAAEKTGLLVDWLSAMELEIANSDQDKLQVDLLFSEKNLPFRPLLISLLLQRASWQSLYNLVGYLLSQNSGNVCPVSVLDYLTALIKSPRLWQGRDKAVPKHARSEDVLKLNENQVNFNPLVNFCSTL